MFQEKRKLISSEAQNRQKNIPWTSFNFFIYDYKISQVFPLKFLCFKAKLLILFKITKKIAVNMYDTTPAKQAGMILDQSIVFSFNIPYDQYTATEKALLNIS